ncbi:MAG: IS110 family transposase, partial [Cyclobacteriaceae bacterium]|nr:IS110 family transposase [Cyclobacteriaceae bacterium]
SYCGIAPFPNTSGTSIRGKTKVSNLANKKIKSLFDLCAKSAIQHNPEMKAYYNRRLEEGKNKMSTINIVRNKLLSRIFAVVNRQTPYVDGYEIRSMKILIILLKMFCFIIEYRRFRGRTEKLIYILLLRPKIGF